FATSAQRQPPESLYGMAQLFQSRGDELEASVDRLCEAALDTYLPLVEQLQQLAEQDVPSPVTIGFTPVLANQLASAAFAQELEAFFDQREAACQEAPASLAATGDTALLPLVSYWQARF